MRKRKSILDTIDAVSDSVGRYASILILPMILLAVFGTVMRYVFNLPIIWGTEAVGFLFGTFFMLAGAYCLRHNAHVNIDILYERWSPRTRAIIDLITYLLFFFVIGVLIWYGTWVAWRSILAMEVDVTPWAPPLYPIKTLIPIAGLLLLVQGISKFIRNLKTAVTGSVENS